MSSGEVNSTRRVEGERKNGWRVRERGEECQIRKSGKGNHEGSTVAGTCLLWPPTGYETLATIGW